MLDRFGPLPDDYLVPDLLRPGLKLVFCGTALGRQSAQARAYYAHPGNFFWRTLHSTGLTPHQFAPQDYARLLDHDIGLTDLCKAHFGNDADLPSDAFDIEALRTKIIRIQPKILAFTSKTGAAAYLGVPTSRIALGKHAQTCGATCIWVLPSPSGQARLFWDHGVWQQLADSVLREPE